MKEFGNKKENSNQVKFDNFDKNFWNKRAVTCCVLSAAVSVATVFAITNIGIRDNSSNRKEVRNQFSIFEERINEIETSVKEAKDELETMAEEWKNSKESTAYIYRTISELQSKMERIKSELHIADEMTEKSSTANIPTEKRTFIENFENLVKDGAPFESFIDTYRTKIDVSKYTTFDDVMKFATQEVPRLTDLRKEYESVGREIFKTKFEESFWEKQKRIIKEKISNAIKIKGNDEKSVPEKGENKGSEKESFEKAGKLLSDGKYTESVEIFNTLNIEHEDFRKLLDKIKKRQALDEAFSRFKEEFIRAEADTSDIDHAVMEVN